MSATAFSSPYPSPHAQHDRISKTALHAAWMAIALGVLVQLVVFIAKLSAGAKIPGAALAVDMASGISWSVVVCGGVAIGSVAAKLRPQAMGLAGIAFAPLAFAAAKGAQRGLGPLVGVPPEVIGPVMIETGAAKAVEYALLGFMLGALIYTPKSTFKAHAALGVAFGIVFASIFAAINLMNLAPGAQLPPPRLAGVLANELVFPVGCSLVIYWVSQLSGRAAHRAEPSHDPTG